MTPEAAAATAAHLDRLEKLAEHLKKLNMTGLAGKLRAMRDEFEAALTAPAEES